MKIDLLLVNGQDNKYEQAYKIIKQNIIDHTFKPNMMLVERRLSEALNISRTPIRQVLQQLVNEGFVEYVANKGMFVTGFNVLDALEIYAIREALDPLMLEGSYIHNYDIVLTKLEKTLTLQIESINKKDTREYVWSDLEFHNVYINYCSYKRLQNFMLSMLEHVKRFAYMQDDPERAELSKEQHKAIYEAYKKKDIEEAKKLLKGHMSSVKQYFLDKLGK